MTRPAPKALRFRTVRLGTGVQVHLAEQGNPEGEPVVFVHGWPDSWFSFSRVLSHLPESRHAYAFDLRGFGDSERPVCCYGIGDLAEDVVSFLDAVGIERATLVGHSLGTFVVRRASEIHPSRIARLVLIGSALTPANDVLREIQALVRAIEDPVPEEFAREFQAGTAYAALPEAFFATIVSESLKLPARLWREVLDAMLAFHDANDLGRISAPTLLLWGEHDALFPRSEQERLVAAIPNGRLVVYPDTGHCPNWERPERVAEDIDDFMRVV